MKPSILLAHPFGNANVRQAALALAEADQLAGFRTCIHWQSSNPLARILPDFLREQLERRTFSTELAEKIRTRPWLEAGRLLASRLGWKDLIAHETGCFSVDAVTLDFDRAVAREIRASHKRLGGVYAYEDGAAYSFETAREFGLSCYYDLPIGYWRAAREILGEEARRQPEWASTLTANADSEAKLNRKDHELDLSDRVFVASRYTASTLLAKPRPPEKVYVIPYGCPSAQAEIAAPITGPLRVLFAGSLGQRKGTSYLLEAVSTLGSHVALTLLGAKPAGTCIPLETALQKHRWIPTLPHAGVLEEMRNHDVLVFPSLFEGFGLVILEALSQGIPVITTANTGGPDVLTDGEDGFIVPIRDSAAIAAKLEELHRDRSRLTAMKNAALLKAGQLRWENYRRELVRCLTLT